MLVQGAARETLTWDALHRNRFVLAAVQLFSGTSVRRFRRTR